MSGLSLISTYESEDESENEDVADPPLETKVSTKLPLPESIVSWKGVEHHEEVMDIPLEHDGRQRSFKHERGNWATLVYINYLSTNIIQSWMEAINNELPVKGNILYDQFHISLTRTLILKFHWIESFVASIRKLSKNVRRFPLELTDVQVYCNEERTRTFLGICCRDDTGSLDLLRSRLDELLQEYQLPPFYEEASFHISFLWYLGDEETNLRHHLPALSHKLASLLAEYPEQSCVNVEEFSCKIGNKMYNFPLR